MALAGSEQEEAPLIRPGPAPARLLLGWFALQMFLLSAIALLRDGIEPPGLLLWLVLGMTSAAALQRWLLRCGATALADTFGLGYCAFAGSFTGSQWQAWTELYRTALTH
jgi:hypothetical protein